MIFLSINITTSHVVIVIHSLCHVTRGAVAVLKHHIQPVVLTCTCRYGVCTGRVSQVTGVVLPVKPMVSPVLHPTEKRLSGKHLRSG